MSFLWLCLLALFLSSQRERERGRGKESKEGRNKEGNGENIREKRELGSETEGGRESRGRSGLFWKRRSPEAGREDFCCIGHRGSRDCQAVDMSGSGRFASDIIRPCHFYLTPLPNCFPFFIQLWAQSNDDTSLPDCPTINLGLMWQCKDRRATSTYPLTDGLLLFWCHLSLRAPNAVHTYAIQRLLSLGCIPLEKGGVLINPRWVMVRGV